VRSSKKSTIIDLKFVSTSAFRQSLQLLTKRRESGYSQCAKNVCAEFNNLSLDDIYSKNFLVREFGDIRLIKVRLQNSELNLSRADGYRLIIICNKQKDHVALLNIYPKRGKYSKSDLTKHEYKEIVRVYQSELKNNTLKEHDIYKELEIVEEKKN